MLPYQCIAIFTQNNTRQYPESSTPLLERSVYYAIAIIVMHVYWYHNHNNQCSCNTASVVKPEIVDIILNYSNQLVMKRVAASSSTYIALHDTYYAAARLYYGFVEQTVAMPVH
jgi:hypothetical protein